MKPDYIPPHQSPAWLSSEAVQAAIREVAAERNTVAAKAICWDLSIKIKLLTAEAGAGQ